MTFANFLSVAWEAATVAGTLIRQHWQKPKSIDYKGAIDLVTSVDRECERRIVEVLRSHFPNHSILAEEETDWVGTENSLRWIIRSA
jgi:myo-inositol-1(or 4)-monophosphatase